MGWALLCFLVALAATGGDASPRAGVRPRRACRPRTEPPVRAFRGLKQRDGADGLFCGVRPSCAPAGAARLRQWLCPRAVSLEAGTTEDPGTTRLPAKTAGESLWILTLLLIAVVICSGTCFWKCCCKQHPMSHGNVSCVAGHQPTGQRTTGSLTTLLSVNVPLPLDEDQNIDNNENQQPVQLEELGLHPPPGMTGLPPPPGVAGLLCPSHMNDPSPHYPDDPPPYSLEDPFPPLLPDSPVAQLHHAQAGSPEDKEEVTTLLHPADTGTPMDEEAVQPLLDLFYQFLPRPALRMGSSGNQPCSWRSTSEEA